MSTSWLNEGGRDEAVGHEVIEVIHAAGFPAPAHSAEADLFVRHQGVPGHDQQRLADARVLIVGAGGLGGWVAVALARSGVRTLTIVDPDRFDRSNASRQLMFAGDLRRPKAAAVARNVASHMVAGGTITAMCLPFEVIEEYTVPADVAIVLVDNNRCRLQAVRFAREREIAAVFSMLSLDSMRIHTFLQGPASTDACLWCAAPNLDPLSAAPCASAVITSCFLSAAQVTFFTHRALMGWPTQEVPFNWRASDLTGDAPNEWGMIHRRTGCVVCGLRNGPL